MKRTSGNNGASRERAYWESSRSTIGTIHGTIEEIGVDEVVRAAPVDRDRRLRTTLLRHKLSFVAVFGVVAALATAVYIVPGTDPRSTPRPSPSPVSQASSTPFAIEPLSPAPELSPSDQPTDLWTPNFNPVWTPGTPPPDPTPSPTPQWANGWPVSLGDGIAYPAFSAGQTIVVGPDGTTYVNGLSGLTAAGRIRNGWLQLPNKRYGLPVGFAADGTIYVAFDEGTPPDTTGVAVYAFAANGKLRAGWPVHVGMVPAFSTGPSSQLYVISNVAGATIASIFSSAGKRLAQWQLAPTNASYCSSVVASDGSLFALTSSTTAGCAVSVFDSKGKKLSQNPKDAWSQLLVGPGGDVVAIGYDAQPYNASIIAKTRIAVLGSDGTPKAGWPVGLEGSASSPSFGPDGSLYMTQLGLGSAPSRILSFDINGGTRAGWPVDLPAGYGAFTAGGNIPSPPSVDKDGHVYVAATDLGWRGFIVAYDSTGVAVPGWPYKLPAPLAAFGGWGPGAGGFGNQGAIVASQPGGGTVIYLALDGSVVALGSDGHTVSGWPYKLPGTMSGGTSWSACIAAPDGGLVAMVTISGTNKSDTVVIRLTPKGKLLR